MSKKERRHRIYWGVPFDFASRTEFVDGATLEFAILNSKDAAVGTQYKEIGGNLVFYSSADSSKVTGDLKESKGQITLELQFPKNWEKAFPSALTSKIVIAPKALKIKPKNILSPTSAPNDLLVVLLEVEGDALTNARSSGDVTLSVTLKPESGSDVPAVVKGTGNGLVLKAQKKAANS